MPPNFQGRSQKFASCAQNVHHRPKRTLAFSDIFPKQLGIFSPHFTRPLSVRIYARMHFCEIYCLNQQIINNKISQFFTMDLGLSRCQIYYRNSGITWSPTIHCVLKTGVIYRLQLFQSSVIGNFGKVTV